MSGLDFGRYVFGPPYFGWLCQGVLMTIVISIISGIGAAAIGLAVLRCHLSLCWWLRAVAVVFVTVFRNLPVVPLLLFLTFAVPGLWQQLWGHPMPRGFALHLLILGLALNTAAYVAEILRAGVLAVAPEQIDAARTLGLSSRAIRLRVVYPQAARIVAPALTSRFIHNTKNSTLALVAPLSAGSLEVVGQATRIAGETFSWAEPLIFAAGIHLLLALCLGRFLNGWADRAQAKVEAAS
jgi:His/Glu/Gln/Arg/opine family amino acid ABC transporter permease subunit